VTLVPAEPTLGPALAAVYRRDREFLRPFEPTRSDLFFTDGGQAERLSRLAADERAGSGLPRLISVDGAIEGFIAASNIVRGSFNSANVGYFVGTAVNGRGVCSAALGLLVDEAFERHGLHRLQAGTLVDNLASQRVLIKNGFRQIGLAPRYLQINGAYRDHILFQLLADDERPYSTPSKVWGPAT
jgi:ribosomal-protein-alanine N-acetyltransferase